MYESSRISPMDIWNEEEKKNAYTQTQTHKSHVWTWSMALARSMLIFMDRPRQANMQFFLENTSNTTNTIFSSMTVFGNWYVRYFWYFAAKRIIISLTLILLFYVLFRYHLIGTESLMKILLQLADTTCQCVECLMLKLYKVRVP